MSLQDDLDAFVGDDDYPPDEPPPVPEDVDGVSRLLRRVRGFERSAEEIRALAQAEIDRITAWREDRVAGLDRQISFFGRSLETYMRGHHEATGRKVKTLNLPNGVLKVREARTTLDVENDEKVAAIVEDQRPAWVKTEKSIRKREASAQLYPGALIERPDYPAPEGREWHEALDMCGWEVIGFAFVPRFRVVPFVFFSVPTQPSFSYQTAAPTEEPDAY